MGPVGRTPGSPCVPYRCTEDQTGAQSFFSIAPITKYMSFDGVEALDLAWNTIIGRSSQALLLGICYRVYRTCLVRLAETAIVSHALFITLALGPLTVSSSLSDDQAHLPRKTHL